MVEFKISPYGNEGDFMLTREVDVDWGEGLPPTNSQTIMMNESDITTLLNTLTNYANQRRN
jgi:hypothetical protein